MKLVKITQVVRNKRITIAREIYRNPDILIFDEPTGSLDRKSTRIIENTILQFKNKKAYIIISHNFRVFVVM